MARRWPTTWARAVVSLTRALGHASAVLVHATVLGPTRVRCLIVGHTDRFSREVGRLSLRCDECGRRTAGWTIGSDRPRVVPRTHGRSLPRVAARREAVGMTREPIRLVAPTRFR
jgi:hypothetical protein